ncbi:apolipoprotein N-acyltransferase [Rhodopirellula halodulae]|uniref:apolipoprotein N-acyltransferase n=1 Tax=Rhodopirellula halodulae TaxID=2894198 RepID=UPI001E5EBFCE|nr:nitrilase-related carbon-nitrogen hydrolase [Rhodopirellula sp. JC737]MCC9658499.1 apolipoprotein N-acyltransferase [Rhodopirellula sp. JC737]
MSDKSSAESPSFETPDSADRSNASGSDNAASWKWCFAASTLAAGVLWASGPPLAIGPLVFVAIVPLLAIAETPDATPWKRSVYLAFLGYWLLSLQGLRHAHPLMFLPWLALSAYLAIYPVLFIGLIRKWQRVASNREGWRSKIPIGMIAAVYWVGLEWIRNYLFTGISVLMLGHALADMPMLIQIADLGGTYAVSFVIVTVNVAMYEAAKRWIVQTILQRGAPTGEARRDAWGSIVVAATLLLATCVYGLSALQHEVQPGEVTVALLGRNEPTIYEQDIQREQAIFSEYAKASVDAVANSKTTIDAVVWPESMFSGGMPWMTTGPNLVVPDFMQSPGMSPLPPEQLEFAVQNSQQQFRERAVIIQKAMVSDEALQNTMPAIIGGCGLVRYAEKPSQFSGVIWVDASGEVAGTYAKNHLVLFGETIPLVKSLPWIKDMVPPGLGLDRGDTGERFDLPGLSLLPNLCIETAVERVPIRHMHQLMSDQVRADGAVNKSATDLLPNAIVTLTNDVWFRNSAVVDHHLRCAQLVAVGCRRPILSAANGGPTAWVDSFGRVVERLPKGEDGVIYAQPDLDSRVSVYVRWQDWPATILGLIAGWGWIAMWWAWWRGRGHHDPAPE